MLILCCIIRCSDTLGWYHVTLLALSVWGKQKEVENFRDLWLHLPRTLHLPFFSSSPNSSVHRVDLSPSSSCHSLFPFFPPLFHRHAARSVYPGFGPVGRFQARPFLSLWTEPPAAAFCSQGASVDIIWPFALSFRLFRSSSLVPLCSQLVTRSSSSASRLAPTSSRVWTLWPRPLLRLSAPRVVMC